MFGSEDGAFFSSEPDRVQEYEGGLDVLDREEERWVATLSVMGAALVLPDDASVDEDPPEGAVVVMPHRVAFEDPEEPVAAGDLLALGDPRAGYRLCRVTSVTGGLHRRVSFRLPALAEVGRPWQLARPRDPWWVRRLVRRLRESLAG